MWKLCFLYFTRWAWAIIVIIATVVSIILLWVSWKWGAKTPTTTVIESTHYAIWNIPFPAITICSVNRISAETAKKMATQMKRPKVTKPDRLSHMFRLALHFQGVGNANKSDYDDLDAVLRMNNMSVLQLTSALAPSCNEILEVCKWKGTITRCEELFQPVNTSEGICCSFNYYGLESNNLHAYVYVSQSQGEWLWGRRAILNFENMNFDQNVMCIENVCSLLLMSASRKKIICGTTIRSHNQSFCLTLFCGSSYQSTRQPVNQEPIW